MNSYSVKSSSKMLFNVYIMFNHLLNFTCPILTLDQNNFALFFYYCHKTQYYDICPTPPCCTQTLNGKLKPQSF